MGTSHITGSVSIGGGTAVTKIIKGTIAIDSASMLTLAGNVTTLTITGAAVGDSVVITPGTAGFEAGIICVGAYVSAADTVKVTMFNTTGGTIDPAALTCQYLLIRS